MSTLEIIDFTDGPGKKLGDAQFFRPDSNGDYPSLNIDGFGIISHGPKNNDAATIAISNSDISITLRPGTPIELTNTHTKTSVIIFHFPTSREN